MAKVDYKKRNKLEKAKRQNGGSVEEKSGKGNLLKKAFQKPTPKQLEKLEKFGDIPFCLDSLTREKANVILNKWHNIQQIKTVSRKKAKIRDIEKRLAKIDRRNERLKRELEVAKFAESLNADLPKSEVWFLKQLKFREIELRNFKQNQEFNGYIPDFINEKDKIIIEIDGSIHQRPDIIEKDKKKDKLYKSKGYEVIRIVAYDGQSLKKGLNKLFRLIRQKNQDSSKKYESNRRKKNFVNRTKAYSKNKRQLESCHLCRKSHGNNLVDYKDKTFRVCDTCKSNLVL